MRLYAAILALLLAGPVRAAWMPDWSQGLTNTVPTRSLLTNLIAAVNERTYATYTGTDTNGVDQFAVARITWTNTYTAYDYSNLVYCGATTQIVAGVTNVYTNYCPSSTSVTVTNSIDRIPARSVVGLVADRIQALAPYFLNNSGGTNWADWFAATTNAEPPDYSFTSLLNSLEIGVVITNGTSTNAYWTRQPVTTNRIVIARAYAIPVYYDVSGVTDTNHPLAGEYVYNAASNRWETSGGYILGDYYANNEYEWFLSEDATTDFFDDFIHESVGYASIPVDGSWVGFIDTNTFTVSARSTGAVALVEGVIASRDIKQTINPLAQYSNVLPAVIAHFDGDAEPLSVTINGSVYAWDGTNQIAYLTNASETVAIAAMTNAATKKWATVTNFVVSGVATTATAVELVYEIENSTFDIDGAGVDYRWYRQPLVEMYKAVNAMTETLPPSALHWFTFSEISGSAASGTDCTPPPSCTATGYTAYLTVGGAVTGYGSVPYGAGLYDEVAVFSGAASEYNITLDEFYCAESFTAHSGSKLNIRPMVYVASNAPPATVDFYNTTNSVVFDSDGTALTNIASFFQIGSASSASSAATNNNLHTAYTGPAYGQFGSESAVSDYIDAMTDDSGASYSDSYDGSLFGCVGDTNSIALSGVGRSIDSRIPYGYPIIRWNFEHQD